MRSHAEVLIFVHMDLVAGGRRYESPILDARSTSETAVVRQLTNGFHDGADDCAFVGQKSNPGNP
jgi:hypothetical protein